MNNRKKTLEYYQGLQYRIELMRDDSDPSEPVWFAKIFELPGCITEADTAEEATEMIQDAMTAWLETALEAGRAIPEPRPAENYSGKFVVRLPKSLHRELAESAKREGVSLNQLVNVALSREVEASIQS